MKRILFLFWIIGGSVLAQIPQAFNYQGIARDANGVPFANKSIKVRLSILSEAGPTQTTLYVESHNITTNQFGLFVLPVGKGTPSLGAFTTINWAGSGKKILKSEIDPDGNGYSLTATSDLQSVPYALAAQSVEKETQVLSLSGNKLTISQGNSVDLPVLGGENIWQKATAIGTYYNEGNVGIGTDNPAVALHVAKELTGNERRLAVLHNTSNANNSFGALGVSAGTADNLVAVHLHAYAKSYAPNQAVSGVGMLSSERLSLYSMPLAAGATGFINFVTGSNATTNPDGGLERMRIEHNGNIGIGTSAPTQKLDINGKLRLRGLVADNTASKILVANEEGIIGYKDINSWEGASPWKQTANGINYAGGKVIVGDETSQGAGSLIVSKYATGTERQFLTVENTSDEQDANTGSFFYAGTGQNNAYLNITVNSKGYFNNNLGNAGHGIIMSEKLSLMSQALGNEEDGFLAFTTGGSWTSGAIGQERMRIDYLGNIGVGTSSPRTKLHVNGGVYIEDASKGIIMKSANGQCWRITVGNTGTLTSTPVTCP